MTIKRGELSDGTQILVDEDEQTLLELPAKGKYVLIENDVAGIVDVCDERGQSMFHRFRPIFDLEPLTIFQVRDRVRWLRTE